MTKHEEVERQFASIYSHELNPSEESDGISVISESEMFKAVASSNESESEELDKATEAKEEDEEYEPITPPMTPTIEAAGSLKEFEEKESRGQFHEQPSSFMPLFASIAFVITITCLYLNIRCLKSEIQAMSSRLQFLEQENQQLKIALGGLTLKIKAPGDVVIGQPQFAKEVDPVEKRNPPKTKTVWFGNEVEDKVEILDKKSSATLPDYCYFTDENDLFYEYNVEHCEAKRRKLEAKYMRERKRSNEKPETFDANPDNAWKVESSRSYDDYITDTLKSLNDEIQDIKRKRGESRSKASSPQVPPATQEEKPAKLKKIEERRKTKKLQRQKEVKSAEWVEKRTNGREEARRTLEKQQDVNWYLKRQNEREIERVGTSAEL